MADYKNTQLYVAPRLYMPGKYNYCLVLDFDPRTIIVETQVGNDLVADLTKTPPQNLAEHIIFEGSLTQCREFAHFNSDIPYIDLIRKT